MARNSRVRRTAVLTAGGLLVLVVAVAALRLGVVAHTPPLTDAAGNEIAGSIAALEKVELGALEQWILIRGVDRSNPVLLWLHGGPGGAQMPFAHYVDARLEERFVVVHWDQRGAGKSNHAGFDAATMRIEQFLQDALELIEYLRARLGAERLVLLGHSWGTRLGIELVGRHPEYFDAYIGVSQVVSHDRATRMARDWLASVIDPEDAPKDWRALRAISIPARRHDEYRALNRLTDAYGGSLDLSMWQLARIATRASEYHALDYARLLQGMNRGGAPMHEGGVMESYDMRAAIPSVAVPVYFFSGLHDYNTPLRLVEEYYRALEAPAKELVVFEHAAHLPFLVERERFAREVIRVAAR